MIFVCRKIRQWTITSKFREIKQTIPTYFSENKLAKFYKKLKVRYKIEYFISPRKKIEMVKYKSLIIKNLHVTAIKGS